MGPVNRPGGLGLLATALGYDFVRTRAQRPPCSDVAGITRTMCGPEGRGASAPLLREGGGVPPDASPERRSPSCPATGRDRGRFPGGSGGRGRRRPARRRCPRVARVAVHFFRIAMRWWRAWTSGWSRGPGNVQVKFAKDEFGVRIEAFRIPIPTPAAHPVGGAAPAPHATRISLFPRTTASIPPSSGSTAARREGEGVSCTIRGRMGAGAQDHE